MELHIEKGRAGDCLDEDARQAGLSAIRRIGRRRLIAELGQLRGDGRRGALLEVGSAHGWFLEEAVPLFDRIVGIEPDDDVRRDPARQHVEVRAGFFPQALKKGERFDVVVFNDVLEHIPSASAVVQAVHDILNAGGLCVINLPMASGFLYRTSKILCRMGVAGPFNRMWQKDFPSPHIYYFSRAAILAIFERSGFVLEKEIAIPTMSIKGLWSRIRYGEKRWLLGIIYYFAAISIAPVLSIFPRDVKCIYMRKIV